MLIANAKRINCHFQSLIKNLRDHSLKQNARHFQTRVSIDFNHVYFKTVIKHKVKAHQLKAVIMKIRCFITRCRLLRPVKPLAYSSENFSNPVPDLRQNTILKGNTTLLHEYFLKLSVRQLV